MEKVTKYNVYYNANKKEHWIVLKSKHLDNSNVLKAIARILKRLDND